MPGLDPGIHHTSKSLAKEMDCRVKPGNDRRGSGEPRISNH